MSSPLEDKLPEQATQKRAAALRSSGYLEPAMSPPFFLPLGAEAADSHMESYFKTASQQDGHGVHGKQ